MAVDFSNANFLIKQKMLEERHLTNICYLLTQKDMRHVRRESRFLRLK
jgi:hypothetical protein